MNIVMAARYRNDADNWMRYGADHLTPYPVNVPNILNLTQTRKVFS